MNRILPPISQKHLLRNIRMFRPDSSSVLSLSTNRAYISAGAEEIGPNPKINNLIRSYSAAKYDTIWILDANTYVPPNTFRHSMEMFIESSFYTSTNSTYSPFTTLRYLPSRRRNCMGSPSRRNLPFDFPREILRQHKSIRDSALRHGKIQSLSQIRARRGNWISRIRTFANYIAEDHLIADTLWYHITESRTESCNDVGCSKTTCST